MTWLAWVFPMTQVATAVTWFWEVLSPIWLLAVVSIHGRASRYRTDVVQPIRCTVMVRRHGAHFSYHHFY